MLTSAEVRGKWVLSVEDWAEIRRLHRAKRVPVKVIARVLGCSLAPASVGGSVHCVLPTPME